MLDFADHLELMPGPVKTVGGPTVGGLRGCFRQIENAGAQRPISLIPFRPGFLSHLRSFNGYDGPEILPFSTRPICLIGADAGQPLEVGVQEIPEIRADILEESGSRFAIERLGLKHA